MAKTNLHGELVDSEEFVSTSKYENYCLMPCCLNNQYLRGDDLLFPKQLRQLILISIP